MLPCLIDVAYRLSLSENSVGTLWWIWEKWPETFLLCSCFWTRFCLASERKFWPGYSRKWVLKSPERLLQKRFHSYPILVNKNTRHQRHIRPYSCLPWQLYNQGSKEDCSFLRYKIPICKKFFCNLYVVGIFLHWNYYFCFQGKC